MFIELVEELTVSIEYRGSHSSCFLMLVEVGRESPLNQDRIFARVLIGRFEWLQLECLSEKDDVLILRPRTLRRIRRLSPLTVHHR